MSSSGRYQGFIDSVITNGKHGPYAVVRVDGLGNVTFSLLPRVWKEKEYPEEGTCVILAEVVKKRGGWRALSARYVRPSDTPPPSSSVNMEH